MQHPVTGAAHRNKSGPVDSGHAYGEDLKALEKIEYADRALLVPFVFVYPTPIAAAIDTKFSVSPISPLNFSINQSINS